MIKLLLNNRYDFEKDTKPWNSRFLAFKQMSSADLNLRDLEGWTLIHHLVAPLPNHTYTNSEVILKLLAQVGVPLNIADNQGVTPLQMAINRGVKVIADTLQELMSIEISNREKVQLLPLPLVDDGVRWDGTASDYNLDCEKLLSQMEKDTKDEGTYAPDPLISLGDEW